MVKKKNKTSISLPKKISNKRRRSKLVKTVTRKLLSPAQKKEIERLINAPRSQHYKNEKLAYDEFHDLEFQRLTKGPELKKSLFDKCLNEFKFEGWVRCISYQFSNHPLSSRGSVNSIGGRFNIGTDISDNGFTPFNALYIAQDQTTALLEKFGVELDTSLDEAMNSCFAKKENTTTIHVKGVLHNVFDIDGKNALKKFTEIISKVNFSSDIIQRRKASGTKHETIQDVADLKQSLYDIGWRFTPQVFDVPANPQIFGQIAFRAGIEAILYSSGKSGKKCLAIFPKNLSEKSNIQIMGEYPEGIKIFDLNSTNFKECL